MNGQLEAVWIKRFRRGPMDPAGRATLVADEGIVGNADQGGQRQVTIIEQEMWDALMGDLDANLDPAARRANLMISGVSLRGSRGKVLAVGECLIRIVGESRPCERMDEALPGLRRAMGRPWGGGAYGVVLEGGEIRVGDAVGLADDA